MTGPNTNLTNRVPSRLHAHEVEVFLESDFPEPSSGVITLEADTTYQLMDSITTTNVFALPVGESVEIRGHALGADLIYDGVLTTGFITSSAVDMGTIHINGLRIELNQDDTKVFDLASTTGGTVLMDNVNFIFNGSGQGLGDFELLVLRFNQIFMFEPELPSTFTTCFAFWNTLNAIQDAAVAVGEALFKFVDNGALNASMVRTNLDTDDSVFYFDPLMVGPIVLDDCGDVSPTKVNMFEPGDSFTISAFADGGGDDVTATATGHTYSNGDHILITNSVNYHGGYAIFGVAGNDFDFTPADAVGFTIDDSQPSTAASNASLTETDSRVTVASSPGYKSSATVCGVWASGITSTTTINTIDIFEDLDLDDLAKASTHMELFILSNANTGEVIYTGDQPISLCVRCIVSGMMAAGGALNVAMRLFQNNGVLPTPDDVDYVSRWITTDPLQTSCEWIVTANPDDTFKVQIANTETTNNIELTQFSFIMA